MSGSASLDGAVVLVTGGASGVGLALAEEAARRGARLFLIDRTDPAPVVQRLRAAGHVADGIAADVTDYASVAAAIAAALAAFGGINIVCNNAGIGASGGLDTVDPAQARAVIDVNLLGYVHVVHAAAPALRAAAGAGGPAALMIVGSEHSLGVPPHVGPLSIYTVTKFAQLGLAETARRDLGGDGVAVSLLAPSWVLTPMIRGYMGASEAMAAAIEPFGQEPGDVARAAFDGLLAGAEIIVTHPASRAFALARLEHLKAEITRALPVGVAPE
ncbi:SDR family NAD(P)-dependent oxidoreductase [Sphingomonas sp. 37zxx]|uniref:SDR family NAD(P)-dependent oxidoreductase n=1 Tax=Sphingomonas sp. 37zxx TaxID=1550073 RepID=UPI00068A7A2E|nr:SDR family oxidoreductase [Sphingomonas sp. 37zxx]